MIIKDRKVHNSSLPKLFFEILSQAFLFQQLNINELLRKGIKLVLFKS